MPSVQPYTIQPTKRLFDIIFSGSILFFFSPILFFIFCAIFLEHCIRLRPFDPLLYSETRMSQGQPFTLYKFNIFKYEVILNMRAQGEFIYTKKLERNGSILCVGWILKQIYMDELPQMFNILKGDMSLVGPRPVNPMVYQKLCNAGSIDKSRVKAGLTGYHQANKNRFVHTQEIADKIYADYCTTQPWYKVLYFDCKILIRTILVLLRAKGV